MATFCSSIPFARGLACQATRHVVSVVACSYEIEPFRLAQQITRFSRRYGLQVGGVVVLNNHHHPLPADAGAWRFVRGGNDCLDFSAYFEGARCIQGQGDQHVGPEQGPVIFLNDSLFTRHSAVATLGALVRVLPILAISTMPFIAGKVDRYFSICFANPWSALQVYVSSYCFAVNQAGLECLLQLPVLAQDDFQYQPFALPIAPGTNHVMARFRAFVSLHVNSQSPYAWHHAQSRGLSEQLLRRKARCIYYEHRLSGEIGLVGAIVPINDKLSLRLSLFVRDYLVRVYFRVQSLALIAFLSAVRRLSNLFKS